MDVAGLLLMAFVGVLVYQGLGMLGETSRGFRMPWSNPNALFKRGRGPAERESVHSKMGFNRIFLQQKWLRQKLELLLLRSGKIHGWAPEDVLFYKELGIGVAALLLWQAHTNNLFYWLGGLWCGFLLPDIYLGSKVRERQTRIGRQLPGVVDLLALTMESGLDLMAAVERIIQKMKPHPLRDEMSNLLQETLLGTPRREALQHLAHRVDLKELHSLTSIIIQSEELGTSLAMVLRNYADDMRSRRILKAEETAGKAPVKLLFPMMVFFFPIIFAIIFGPIALSVLTNYK